jgi:cytochrome P450
MTITPDTDVYYDPYHIDIVNDPYPVYARLREEAPIYYNERYDFWAISRYADVEKALSPIGRPSPTAAATSSN